jgi:hypothetical protein
MTPGIGHGERLDHNLRTLTVQRPHVQTGVSATAGRQGNEGWQYIPSGSADSSRGRSMGDAGTISPRTPTHSSTIIIGARNTASPSGQISTPATTQRSAFQENERRGSSFATEAPAAQFNRQEIPRISRGIEGRYDPPPASVQKPAPQFNQQEIPRITRGIEDRFDSRPSVPAERPQYGPPPAASHPSRSEMAAPPASHAPSAPAPAPSASSHSDSGHQNSDRDPHTH